MHDSSSLGRRAAIVRITDVTERRRLEAESTVISEVIMASQKLEFGRITELRPSIGRKDALR